MDDPFGRPTLIPAIYYKNPMAALDWLEKAFGFERTMVVTDTDGNLAHSEMKCGGGQIMVGSEWTVYVASPASTGGRNTHSIHILPCLFSSLVPSLGWWFPGPSVTELGQRIDNLFYLILYIVTAVFIGTQIALAYVLWRASHSKLAAEINRLKPLGKEKQNGQERFSGRTRR